LRNALERNRNAPEEHPMSDKTSSKDLERKLRDVVDKQEIYDVLMRYCCGVDRGDLDLILSAFHDDALDNHVGVEERAVERFTRTVKEASGMKMTTSHQLGNVYIKLHGDTAYSQSYLTAWHRFDVDGRPCDWVISGRYVDRLERRNGEWRIAHRTVVYDFERYDEVGPKPKDHPTASLFDHAVLSSRSRADYSYQLLNDWGPGD
jgi:ketosteroid isomerase-like protein